MSKKFLNKGKTSFLASLPTSSLDDDNNNLVSRCKFNFSYFEKQSVGIDFDELEHDSLLKLITKVKSFSGESLSYWQNQRIGSGNNNVYEKYGRFPSHSHFTYPKQVPHQAEWGRFRIDQATRLCGFTIPEGYNGLEKNGYLFCSNTFYVVFLDPDHRFYPLNKR